MVLILQCILSYFNIFLKYIEYILEYILEIYSYFNIYILASDTGLENPMDRQAAVHEVSKSRTRLSNFHFHSL